MEYPRYTYPVASLHTGASFGNRYAFARYDAESNLQGLWSASENEYYVGEWKTEIIVEGKSLKPQETTFFPESQTTRFAAGSVTAEKQCFIPFLADRNGDNQPANLRSAFCLVRLRNISAVGSVVLIRHTIWFPARVCDLFTKQPTEDQTEKKFDIREQGNYCEITTKNRPAEARLFGSSVSWSKCTSDEKSLVLEYRIILASGKTEEAQFALVFSPQGINEAARSFRACEDGGEILRQSISSYREILSRSFMISPDPLINRGLQWAKVNTVRVQHCYRIGEGFTNDPPQDIIVIRDLAWYVLGSDYLTPQFSRAMIALSDKYAFHDGGKLTEYLHADESTPVQHDYKLNINDDTPLFVYAVYHHAVTCENGLDLEHALELMKRGCEWILSQISDGLVRCRADGTNVWGICGWRNIIDNYNLTGAVTEINAECYYALKLTAELARHLHRQAEFEHYSVAAERLKAAVNSKLISEKTGMYLLNLGNDGVRHHDVTGDLIFPVMFGVANDEVRKTILKKLTDNDMWTRFGSRTVSTQEHNYDPDFGYQLVGGLWHNLTAWAAYCIREQRPDKLVEGMKNIYRMCEIERPKDFVNVVPGQFPERLHGETYVSRGMTMSPWMPPTYLWLGVEGLFGVKATLDGLEMHPVLPPGWNWIAMKNLLYKGHSVDAFMCDGTLYSNFNVKTSYPLKVGASIEVTSDNEAIISLGLKIGDELIVFVAADCDVDGSIGVELNGTHLRQKVSLRSGEGRLLRASEMISSLIKPKMELRT